MAGLEPRDSILYLQGHGVLLLVRWRIRKLWRRCQGRKSRGGVEASLWLTLTLGLAGHGAGGGIETHHGHPSAGLAERQGEGGGLAELTDLVHAAIKTGVSGY